MTAPVDPERMRRALRLAELGWGRVHPNPLVGAVLVDAANRVIAEGWHDRYGGPHAEVAALAKAGPAARGATLYVSLEPCSHHGKTPPCTEAILAADVHRVIFAARDPDTTARGGAERLRAAGLDVEGGLLEAEARRQNAPFFFWHERRQPYIALKLALSIDGAMGLPDRPRILVTGETARAEANRLRAGFDAILVGVGTVLADDPLLTVRTQSVRVPSRRVVLDSDARLPLSSRLLTDPAPVLVLTAPDASPERVAALQEAGVQVRRVARRGEGGMDASGVVAALAEEGIRSVFCEGGVRVARTLLGADLVERQYLFMAAGRLGAQGLRPLEGLPATTPGGWSVARSRRVGADALLVLERERSEDVHGDR